MELSVRSAGYAYLLEKFHIVSMPHWRRSLVGRNGSPEERDGAFTEVFRPPYWPGASVGEHLAFALKYDGVNLDLLARIFAHVSRDELAEYVATKPTGKYARRIWFFYELLTEETLPLENVTSGNYVNALEEERYYTVRPGQRSPRQRVVNNLLGDRDFCPIVRKTEALSRHDLVDLRDKCEQFIASYPPALLRRALHYLYSKETKSSFAIEQLRPHAPRAEKFIAALKLAGREDFCTKERLIQLQHLIVDSRFRDVDYRCNQNYVGQSVTHQRELIHFVSPKPEDLHRLMSGLLACHQRMATGAVDPVVHAAVIAYGFVFLHPFDDGNGRIHRFLIHNILSTRGMVPAQLIFPVSATMLKNRADYDASLEAFSRPLLQLVDYQLDETGAMKVNNDTAGWYRYNDMTAQAEALSAFIDRTVAEELAEELVFLANHDRTFSAIQGIVDMPDRLIDLFIRVCLQNDGTLSARKRAAHFAFLSDEEVSAIEQAIRRGYALDRAPHE